MAVYYQPPTNPDGSRMTYAQRKAARIAQEKPKPKPQEPTCPEFYDLPYEERQRIRRAEHQAQQEAAALTRRQEQERKAAEAAAVPEHERRPRNVWTDLIRQWESSSYRPDVARRLREYRRREKEEEKRIDALMKEKKTEYARKIDPERLRALEHLERVTENATEDPALFVRLRAIVESGNAGEYWSEVQPLLQRRLAAAQEHAATSRQSQIESATEASAAKAQALDTEELLNGTGGNE